MKQYEVAITITDVTSVDASSEEEAYEIARDIFKEDGYDLDRAYELDVIDVRDMEE